MSHSARKRWAILILVLALPAYIVAALVLVSLFDRPPLLLELAIYIVLGVVWTLPLKRVFKGIGQADPDASED
ncbi:DUF2842 domain-containing protein [Pararhodobacter sp.]